MKTNTKTNPLDDPWLILARAINPKHTEREAAYAACKQQRDGLLAALERMKARAYASEVRLREANLWESEDIALQEEADEQADAAIAKARGA